MKLSLDLHKTENALKHLHYGSRVQPARDWLVVLGVCIVLLAASIVFNTLLFLHVEQGDMIGSGAVVDHATAPASLKKVELLFTTRQEEETRYRNSYRFVDPSL